jgi:hypothetical protein
MATNVGHAVNHASVQVKARIGAVRIGWHLGKRVQFFDLDRVQCALLK